jgi:hypothetical protein
MSQPALSTERNLARHKLIRRLATHGGWMGRAELTDGLSWSEARLDDELADLVVSEAALFNPRAREYRLAGTPLARQAASRLLRGRPEVRRCVLARQAADKALYQVGMAQRDEAGDVVVMAELELPYPTGDLAGLERLQRYVLDLADRP